MFWLTHSCPENRDLIFEISGSRGALVWTSEAIIHRTLDGAVSSLGPVHDLTASTSLVLEAAIEKLAKADTFVCDLEIARTHTLCANGAIDSSPIQAISPEYLEPRDASADFMVIRQIEEACHRGFQTNKLWSELSVPWARPGEHVDLRDYAGIRGSHVVPSHSTARASALSEDLSLAPVE